MPHAQRCGSDRSGAQRNLSGIIYAIDILINRGAPLRPARFNHLLGGNDMPRLRGPAAMTRLPTASQAVGFDA